MFKLLVAGGPSLHGTIAARGPHDVAVTASGIGLLACCPELRRATAQDADGNVRLPYQLVLRMCLRLAGPKLKADKPDEWKAKAWRYLFDPAALGRVLAAVYASPHFDSTRVYKTLPSLANALRAARDRMFLLGDNLDALLVRVDPSERGVLAAALLASSQEDHECKAFLRAAIFAIVGSAAALPLLAETVAEFCLDDEVSMLDATSEDLQQLLAMALGEILGELDSDADVLLVREGAPTTARGASRSTTRPSQPRPAWARKGMRSSCASS